MKKAPPYLSLSYLFLPSLFILTAMRALCKAQPRARGFSFIHSFFVFVLVLGLVRVVWCGVVWCAMLCYAMLYCAVRGAP